MRTIKFRGKNKRGKFVYGDLSRFLGADKPTINFDTADGYNVERVTPDSIAQLIAVDIHGHEVYEGDKVIRVDNFGDLDPEKVFPMAATFDDFTAINNGEIIYEAN